MLATHKRLVQDAEKLAETKKPETSSSSSRKKRTREVRKMLNLVKAALDEGRIEDDIKGLRMERVFSRASTKQAMIARVSLSNHRHQPIIYSVLSSSLHPF